mgnify:FL=1
MRIRHLAAAAVLAAAVLALATCSNPVDLVEAATVEVMKANDRYLEVVDFGPANNATNISPSASIWIEFDRDLDESTVTTSTIEITPVVSWASDFNPASNTLTIQPTFPGDAVTTYTVALKTGLKGADGRDLIAERSWSFEVKEGPSGSVSINGGATYSTTTTANTLNFSVNTVAQWYRYSLNPANLSSATWTDIPTYPTFDVTNVSLPNQGTNTVYVQFWDNGSEFTSIISPINDSIIVDSVAPNAPTVSGTTPTTALKPTWTWTSGGGGGNGTYRYQLDGTAGAWTTTSSTSYTPGSNLALGSHTLYVQERDTAGNWSGSGSKVIAVAPIPPTGVSATDDTSTSQVTVSWTASSGAVSYYVYRDTAYNGSYATSVGDTASTSINDTTATPGTVYYYKVKAYANSVYSDFSGYDSGVRRMSVPGSFTASDNTDTAQVALSWTAVTNAQRYYIYRATSSTGTYSYISYVTGTSYNDTGATPGVQYYYKVRSYANGYYSDYSGYNAGMRRMATPLGVSATDGTVTTGVTVSWSGVTGASSYYVYRATTSTGTYLYIASTSSLSYTDTGVSSTSTTYYYKVAALGAAGYPGDQSAYNSGYRGLAAPTGVNATDGTGNGSGGNYVRISWAAVSGAEGYYVYRADTYNGTYSYVGGTTTNLYLDYAAPYGTTYYFKVRAYDVSATYLGAWSSYNSGWRWDINNSSQLQGWWTFDNTWYDMWTPYADFTPAASPKDPSFAGVKIGTSAVYLDGDDIATSSGQTFMSADRKSVSVAFWVYPTVNYTSITHIMMCSDFGISQSSNNYITFSISIPSTNSVSVPVTLNTYTLIVGTYDGSTIRIYKNGSLYTSQTWAGTVSNPGRNLTIGGWTSGVWKGYLDDLRIYNRVLTATEIAALYGWR